MVDWPAQMLRLPAMVTVTAGLTVTVPTACRPEAAQVAVKLNRAGLLAVVLTVSRLPFGVPPDDQLTAWAQPVAVRLTVPPAQTVAEVTTRLAQPAGTV